MSTTRDGRRPGIFSTYRRRLENETFAGLVLLAGAVVALVWANSPWRESYQALADHVVGPESLHLALPVSGWAADGLLAIFFFVVGLELKTEFVTGALRDARLALVPILAAVFGMVGPAVVYTVVQAVSGTGRYEGWAIPVATDIAFAVAVLGIFGRGLPPAVRTFLLTLAVVDDLLGITVIAIFYTEEIHLLALLGSLALTAVFALLVNRRVTHWWLLVPLAVVAWALMHASGVHATIAGVLMGLTVPALARGGEEEAMTHRFVERIQPWSAGLVLPIFAFFAAGVSVVDSGGLGGMLADPVAVGVYVGLPLGKLLGIWGGVALLTKLTRLRLGSGIDLADIFPVAMVAGIGFTVSLLIASLSFDPSDPASAHARVAVLLGSLIAAVLGAILLRLRAAVRVRGRAAQHPRGRR
ncbi:Na+/H+ antiporter NhaA [Georgenia sp. SUBG003]|uniref:Na+/H+ antiporter NhaA n=1 Tax=Georgenia sp. SUBG003 TaxID=1497974 RepID=UPI0006948953